MHDCESRGHLFHNGVCNICNQTIEEHELEKQLSERDEKIATLETSVKSLEDRISLLEARLLALEKPGWCAVNKVHPSNC